MAKLGEIFRTNMGYNPTHGCRSNSLHPLLTRQFRGSGVIPGTESIRIYSGRNWHSFKSDRGKHWSSETFMRYIRKQVLSLSHGISAKMLTYKKFFTVPDFVNTFAVGDMRGCSNTSLASTSIFIGSHTNMHRGLHPAFHLSH
jgi:hypothetical protein